MPIQSAFPLVRFGDRLLAGDESVLADVQKAFCPALRRTLSQRYCGRLQPADIDEILNFALFRLWTNRESFDASRGALKTWFWQIAMNGARNVIKHLAGTRHPQLEYIDPSLLDALAIPLGQAPTILKPSVPTAEVKAAVAALGRLSEIQRRILLADAAAPNGAVPCATLASELSLTTAAVRVNRHRALKRLRSRLGCEPTTAKRTNRRLND